MIQITDAQHLDLRSNASLMVAAGAQLVCDFKQDNIVEYIIIKIDIHQKFYLLSDPDVRVVIGQLKRLVDKYFYGNLPTMFRNKTQSESDGTMWQ